MHDEVAGRSLDVRRLQIAEKMAAGIEARRRGGPSLKIEHLALIDELAGELSPADIVEWKRRVEEGYAEARPWQPLGIPRRKEQNAEERVEPPETEVAPSVLGRINRLVQMAGRAYRKKSAEPAEEVQEEFEEAVVEDEADAATIERALVPVKRFSIIERSL
jgi:hypothetical protein